MTEYISVTRAEKKHIKTVTYCAILFESEHNSSNIMGHAIHLGEF